MAGKREEYTRESFRTAVGEALGRKLKDEKTIALLTERGMLSPRERLTVGDAIARLRLLYELDDPSPGGFEKLARELNGEDPESVAETAARIEMDIPEEYKV